MAKPCLILVELARILVGILLMSITTTMDPALTDQGNLLKSDWANYSWIDSQN